MILENQKVLPQKILVTGASGLVGTQLVQLLESKGHEVIKLSFLKSSLGTIYCNPHDSSLSIEDFGEIDTVIHLSGENISKRWTEKVKKQIYESRVIGSKFLANAILRSEKRPKLFISASGANIYPPNKLELATEETPVSVTHSFFDKVVHDWESATKDIEGTETRLVVLRIGLVLSSKGGILPMLLPVFKAGLGGPQGPGTQLMNWIDLDDLVNATYFCISNSEIKGPVNMVAPEVVTNAEFFKSLASSVNRRSWLRTPAFLLKLILGELAKETILRDFNLYPKKLIESGFEFKYGTLDKCLNHLLNKNK